MVIDSRKGLGQSSDEEGVRISKRYLENLRAAEKSGRNKALKISSTIFVVCGIGVYFLGFYSGFRSGNEGLADERMKSSQLEFESRKKDETINYLTGELRKNEARGLDLRERDIQLYEPVFDFSGGIEKEAKLILKDFREKD